MRGTAVIRRIARLSSGRRSKWAVVGLTKSTAVVRIDVTNADRLVALAQGTVTIRPPKPKE